MRLKYSHFHQPKNYLYSKPIKGLQGCGVSCRFSFNGKENDNEVIGVGSEQDYGMRIYDTRIGRFLSVDPLTGKFPWWTPYQFAGNMPIKFVDLDGMEPMSPDIPNSRQANRKINAYDRKLERFARQSGGSSSSEATIEAFNTANADKSWMYISEKNRNSGDQTTSGTNSEANIETIWYSTAQASSIRKNPQNIVNTPTFGQIIQIGNVVNGGTPSASTANSVTIPFALPAGGMGNLIITNTGTTPINVSADQNNSPNNPSTPGTTSIIPTTTLNAGAIVTSGRPANMANGSVLHATGPNGAVSSYSIGFQPLIGNIQTRTPRFKIGSPIVGSPNFKRDGAALRSHFGALFNY